MSNQKCCLLGCKISSGSNETLHTFPHPIKHTGKCLWPHIILSYFESTDVFAISLWRKILVSKQPSPQYSSGTNEKLTRNCTTSHSLFYPETGLEDIQMKKNLGSASMLPKSSKAGWCSRACRSLRKLTLISGRHPLTFEHIRSYPVMIAERQRQIVEAGWTVIHPFSLFSLFWNNLMVFVNLIHMVVSSLRLCYFLNPLDKPVIQSIDYPLLVLHILCLTDMVIKFNTAYLEGQPGVVVLDRRSIFCHYLRGSWLFDLVSSAPVSFILLAMEYHDLRWYLITHSLPLFRAARLCSVAIDLRILMRKLTRSPITYRLVRHTMMFWLTMHWFTCLIYLPPVFYYYWFGAIPPGFNRFLPANHTAPERNITQLPVCDRYQMAMFISISAFFGTGFSMFRAVRPAEIMANSIIILGATMFMTYTSVFFLKIYMTVYNSSMRYQELMNQVEKYMRHKQFPASLKRRVRAFYGYRFQERYFKEETALQCLSEQLRNEISLHTCQNLVKKVKLFQGLPSTLVGTLLGCLKPEVYLPNDLIVRVGDFGDCMYFLSSGTVAVYSSKGAEVCHLEDGEFFGMLALLLKDRKRLATVVAIEITQVYRLDVDDFRRFILTNQDLFNRIEVEATRRINETVLVDDAYRRERERRHEQQQKEPASAGSAVLPKT